MLTPLNTAFNRKLSLTEQTGNVVAEKNGEVYFYMVVDGNTEYYICEENLFHKNFKQTNNSELKELNEDEWKELKKKCKNYPY